MRHAAIPSKFRAIVAHACNLVAEDQGETLDEDERSFLTELGEAIDHPGPPLVSASVAYTISSLVGKLAALEVGEELDHEWGFVRRDPETPGFRLADPGQKDAKGGWRYDDPVALAQEMFDTELTRRGI